MPITLLEYRVVHNNVECGVIVLEHPKSGVVLKLFLPAKVKYVKTGQSFVSVIKLVTGLREGKERLQLRNMWST